jgi:hypothetical protein
MGALNIFNSDSQRMFGVVWWIYRIVLVPFILEQRLTSANYLHFPAKELQLLMETRLGIFFQHDGASPHIGQVTVFLNQHCGNRWRGSAAPIPWPPRSPDLTYLISFYGGNGLQDQSTDKSGTLAPNYECCCLHIRTPRNDVLTFSAQH